MVPPLIWAVVTEPKSVIVLLAKERVDGSDSVTFAVSAPEPETAISLVVPAIVATYAPVVSVPNTVESATIVAVRVALPNSERVTLPDKSPANVITGDFLITTAFSMLPVAIAAFARVAAPDKLDVPETIKVLSVERSETFRVPEEEMPAVDKERADTTPSPSSIETRAEDNPVVEVVFNNSVYESAIVRPVNALMLRSPTYRLIVPMSLLLNHSLANSIPLVSIPWRKPRYHTYIRLRLRLAY
jgi:hypothetical protein